MDIASQGIVLFATFLLIKQRLFLIETKASAQLR